MWQPDGWGFRARIGLLVAASAIGSEAEIGTMAPAGVSVHAARVPRPLQRSGGAPDATIDVDRVRAFADPPLVDDAAERLAAAPLHAIGFAFTSSSYVRGAADDTVLRQRLEERTRGIPVAVTAASMVLALRALGASRLAIIDPPWFSSELSAMGAAYFNSQGLDVVDAAPADLPIPQRAINPGQVYEWARAHVPAAAETVVFSGNGFRTAGVIQVLEEDLGVPVVTANQALCWHLLRLAGVRAPVAGYGRLFAHPLPD